MFYLFTINFKKVVILDDLTVDQQKAPSSRPSSARWKAATSAVMASNMLTKLGKNKGTGKKSTVSRTVNSINMGR